LASLFGGDESNLFGEPAAVTKEKDSSSSERKSTMATLFNSSASDENLFDEVVKDPPVVKSQPPVPAKDPMASLFGEPSSSITETAKPSLPAAAAPPSKKTISSLGASDLFGSGGLFDDNEDSDSLFGSTKKAEPSTKSSNTSTAPLPASKSKLNDLFGDNDDEDSLFAPKKTERKPSITTTVPGKIDFFLN
jgi:hypothetical protein